MPKEIWQNLVTLKLLLNSEIKKSTAKGIHNDIVLFQSSQLVVDSRIKKINKVLNGR